MAGDRERCLDAGMDDYVAKPLKSKELFQVIEEAAARFSELNGHSTNEPQRSVPVPEENSQVIDKDTALDQLDGDKELLGQMVTLIMEDCPRFMEEIRGAIAKGDAEVLQRASQASLPLEAVETSYPHLKRVVSRSKRVDLSSSATSTFIVHTLSKALPARVGGGSSLRQAD